MGRVGRRLPAELEAVLDGGGEVGALMRQVDWAATPLGPMERWKQSLRSALSICLSSRFPIVMYWGPELTVLYNDAYSRILGAKHPWALGKPCAVCWAEIWDTIGPMLHQVVETGEATWSDDLELHLERNGAPEECYFSFSFSPVRVESGAVGGVFTAVVETTERVLSDRRLRLVTSIGERSSGAQSAEEACIRCVEALELSDARPVPFAFFYLCEGGATPRLVATKGASPPSRTWPFEAAPVVVTLEAGDIEGTTRWAHDIPPTQAIVMPIGTDGFLVSGLNPLRPLDAGYKSFFDFLGRQVSAAVADGKAYGGERKRAEALAELDRAKTEFFSNISHEFRTPLTLLLGPLESLRAQVEPGSAQGQELELARRNALRLLKLVTTLLDFSRIDAMRRDAAVEAVELATFTAELASVFRSAIEAAGLKLVIDCEPLAEPVYLDRAMWETVVMNLMSNALKFTVQGEISVRVAAVDGVAELVVEDSGVGIAADVLPRIFERFYRVREPAARTQEGAGIGLALVRELVQVMGGDIDVASEPGRGTTFRIRVPFRPAPPEVVTAHRAPALVAAPYLAEVSGWLAPAVSPRRRDVEPARRVLLADDNADMRAYVEQLLSERWDVEAVADGMQALEAARRNRPDLVLTDVMMPRLDGFQLLAALRSDPATREVPVIILSARAGEDSSIEGLSRGADDYLVKPFTAQELIARVNANMAMAEMRNEIARARSEAQLAAERSAFLNMAAHELRTPLTVIGGYLDLVLNGTLPAGTRQGREALEKVAFKTQEGVRLVEQMLLSARIEAGKLRVRTKPIDLRDLALEAVERAQALASLECKTVTSAVPDAPVMADADVALAGLILDNLIGNAIFHGGSTIKVEVTEAPPGVRVVDDGPGIGGDSRTRLFEPFVRLESDPSVRSGAGLGLAMSRRLAELHGGSLVMEDTAAGASFLLSLPASDDPRPDPPRHDPAQLARVEPGLHQVVPGP